MVMARRWYASSPVIDGLPLIAEPGFWAAHLADLYEGLPVESFGVDAADAGAVLDRLHDASAWPVFHVPLAGGHSIVVHYNNGEDNSSTDYFLTHPDWSCDEVLASNDEDRIGPGLCWPELTALFDCPPRAVGVTDPHTRLLLLLPVLGDPDVSTEAISAVKAALKAHNAPEACEALARRLLQGHPGWGAEPWWFDAEEGSWICDGNHSPRRSPIGDHLPDGQRAALRQCLTPRQGLTPSNK
ncbi:hypothetical protein AB0I10_03905 [Streptomyces sp. NPDC050636]|uniref:hypothetical protein n=1 Tax=Streptomyces sp. NPDC050636 TaxID=3154510 RepID=UPI003445A6E1